MPEVFAIREKRNRYWIQSEAISGVDFFRAKLFPNLTAAMDWREKSEWERADIEYVELKFDEKLAY